MLVRLPLAQEFAIAVLGHPLRARQMSIVDLAGPHRINCGIEAEENARGLTPVGPVPMGIQKPQVQHHVLTIVGGELLALRRFIKELRCRLVHHRPPRCSRCFCDFPSALALIQDSGSQIFSGSGK